MQSSPESNESSPPPLRCRTCQAVLAADSARCAACGTSADESPADELRNVIYLLSELDRWKAEGLVGRAQGEALRETYERRRERLRAQLAPDTGVVRDAASPHLQTPAVEAPETSADARAREFDFRRSSLPDAPERAAEATTATELFTAPTQRRRAFEREEEAAARAPFAQSSRRGLVETLAEPRTLRLLLYTGASMFVVGVVIWLRDVLYLKLQEPVVQAALLALGTFLITAAGWYTVLRTRLRLTGRALTLVGAVLFPVNFWFLVRAGLVASGGRAWVVCALCAALYAHTAAFLREKLYVYLTYAASVAALWALIYRTEREAFGSYALALMAASLLSLHLSQLFTRNADDGRRATDDKTFFKRLWSAGGGRPSGDELWGAPLAHAALFGAALGALGYMPLRVGQSPSLYERAFDWRGSGYDSGIAIVLFAALAYVAWFAGRRIHTKRRVMLYTTAALALLWAELLALDGLRAPDSIRVLALAFAVTSAAFIARSSISEDLAAALFRASTLVSVLLVPAAFVILLGDAQSGISTDKTLSASFAFIAATFAALSGQRFTKRLGRAALAYASAVTVSIAFLVGLASVELRSETLVAAACSLWPFALYAVARLARKREREAQLVEPFARVAGGEFVLLLLLASFAALVLHLTAGAEAYEPNSLRGQMFCVLSATIVYGALRVRRERSSLGAGLASSAALTLVAASADASKQFNLLPGAWPTAAALIPAAFIIGRGVDRLLPRFSRKAAEVSDSGSSPETIVRFAMDFAVVVCALLWFTKALVLVNDDGYAAVGVLLLAVLYWVERAAQRRRPATAHIVNLHAGALFLALLVALGTDARWFAALIAVLLFPAFFAFGRFARARGAAWLAGPADRAAVAAAVVAFVIAMIQALEARLRVGDPLLLAPCLAVAGIAIVSFGASLWSKGRTRVRYFRAGLYATVIAFALACLRAGFEPSSNLEIYTTPVAVLLLVTALLSVRRKWEAYDADADTLLWAGSLLLCGPLLARSLHFRLLLDEPALWRDLATLSASLALVLFGVVGRMRAPVVVGAIALAIELTSLALTSVEWAQVPLKYYLITVGALLLLVFGTFEYRREQLLRLRERINVRREYARERFGEWR